jgi:membrane-bound inhibitor of C-type lysozyme
MVLTLSASGARRALGPKENIMYWWNKGSSWVIGSNKTKKQGDYVER